MVNFGLADTLKGRSLGRSVVRLIVRTVVRSLGNHSVGLSVRPIPRSMEPFLLRSFIGSIGLPVRPSVQNSNPYHRERRVVLVRLQLLVFRLLLIFVFIRCGISSFPSLGLFSQGL